MFDNVMYRGDHLQSCTVAKGVAAARSQNCSKVSMKQHIDSQEMDGLTPAVHICVQ